LRVVEGEHKHKDSREQDDQVNFDGRVDVDNDLDELSQGLDLSVLSQHVDPRGESKYTIELGLSVVFAITGGAVYFIARLLSFQHE
jgi:hypothetical protein